LGKAISKILYQEVNKKFKLKQIIEQGNKIDQCPKRYFTKKAALVLAAFECILEN
jgi:hypothetical protein